MDDFGKGRELEHRSFVCVRGRSNFSSSRYRSSLYKIEFILREGPFDIMRCRAKDGVTSYGKIMQFGQFPGIEASLLNKVLSDRIH
jgi:hypothetical protein